MALWILIIIIIMLHGYNLLVQVLVEYIAGLEVDLRWVHALRQPEAPDMMACFKKTFWVHPCASLELVSRSN